MAGESGSRDPVVSESAAEAPAPAANAVALLPERLKEEPFEYRFFQAVRLLQLMRTGVPVGRFSEPSKEAVRFGAHQRLGFPPSEIHSLEFPDQAPPQMVVNFMGLTGPMGELPVFYTAYLRERRRLKDSTAASFFDIFNHRAISLFYRAWEKYRFTVPYERGEGGGLTQFLLDFVGLGTKGLQDRQEVDDQTLCFYAGLLTQKPRSAVALRDVLTDYFGVPVEVLQFIGVWRPLEKESQCLLDEEPMEANPSTELGVGTVAGDEVWDPQSAVRIRIGPLTLEQYLEFLPDGRAFPALRDLCRFYAGQEFDFEVQLVLKREEAPGCGLGAGGPEAPRLGWVSWIKSKPMDRDPADTVTRLWEET
jgi:type VI secretion system protein ImpH